MRKTLLCYTFLCSVFFTSATFAVGEDMAPEKKNRDGNYPDVAHGAIQDGVFFIEPKNGAELPTQFTVKFGVHGMRVKPAGELEAGTGHHHLIIAKADKKASTKGHSIKKAEVIPKDETHRHFGKGEEETDLTLEPGKYLLTLQFADGAHRSYGAKWSKTIIVTIKK